MKIKEGFILKTVAGENIVVPIGNNVNFNSIISLNETGTFLWRQLLEEKTTEQLLEALLNEYNVDEETAAQDIDRFTKRLSEVNLI